MSALMHVWGGGVITGYLSSLVSYASPNLTLQAPWAELLGEDDL